MNEKKKRKKKKRENSFSGLFIWWERKYLKKKMKEKKCVLENARTIKGSGKSEKRKEREDEIMKKRCSQYFDKHYTANSPHKIFEWSE